MPKIINRGGPRKPIPYVGTCRSCGCEAEWERSEVNYTHHPNEPAGNLYGKCPQCGSEVWVRLKG